MVIQKILFLWIFLHASQSLCALILPQQFKQAGYVEICDNNHEQTMFDSLYACFDELIQFLQTNPTWAHKLYIAKERFIRSKDRSCYSTDFFGLYDESTKAQRAQISFYYSIHFHEFIHSYYPDFKAVPEINDFFTSCFEIQKPYANLFVQTATQLDLQNIFASNHNRPPILLKVVKYLPSYVAKKPHYDGTAFSLFLNSTDNQSLLLCAYKPSFTPEDFMCPTRSYNQNSILLIPGALLTEYSIYPTPHIVTQSGKTRYATIAFAMRPNYIHEKIELADLPNFKSIE